MDFNRIFRGKRFIVYAFVMLFTISTNSLFAESNSYTVLPDTVHVDEVVISGHNINKYQVGAKIEKIESFKFESAQDGTLDQLLLRYTPISIKSLASGFSTVRFRGTSPDHTSVKFGGLDINSLTLGHSNFGNIPVYLFDELGVQYGSSSSVNGSGSIGGAIHLGLKSYWVDGIKAEIRVSQGSYGEQLYGFKYYSGNGKFESVTRGYWYANHNNFKFINSNYRDFENGVFEIEDVQKNANVDNKGIIQELNFRIAPKHTVKTKIWIEDDWHLIQQNMGTNLSDTNIKVSMEDFHIRAWLDYKNEKNLIKYRIGAGGAFDQNRYNNELTPVEVKRFESEGEVETDVWDNMAFKVGYDLERLVPIIDEYDENIENEDRLDFFAQYRLDFFEKRLKTTVNLRKGFVSGFKVPFTPAIGTSYLLYSGDESILKLSGNVAYSYRVPTFNDRFWGKQGNPDLNSENGMNYEFGAQYSYCNGLTSGTVKANLFYMDIDNWILWKFSTKLDDETGESISDWYPENVQRVISKGVELQADINWQAGGVDVLNGTVLSYNPVERKDGTPKDRQMEYVPLYTASLFSSARYREIDFGFDARFNPWQYIDDGDKNIIDGYFLLNINGGYMWKISNEHAIKLSGHINNILNVNYQSTFGYAMPRRTYRVSITYNFN